MSQNTYEIEVTRTSVVKTGTRNNKPWTLYRLEDFRWTGTMPGFLRQNVPFTTFDALSGVVQVTVEPYEKNGTLENYSVKRVGPKARAATARNGGAPTGDLEARAAQLESEVASMREQFAAAIRAFGVEA